MTFTSDIYCKHLKTCSELKRSYSFTIKCIFYRLRRPKLSPRLGGYCTVHYITTLLNTRPPAPFNRFPLFSKGSKEKQKAFNHCSSKVHKNYTNM